MQNLTTQEIQLLNKKAKRFCERHGIELSVGDLDWIDAVHSEISFWSGQGIFHSYSQYLCLLWLRVAQRALGLPLSELRHRLGL